MTIIGPNLKLIWCYKYDMLNFVEVMTACGYNCTNYNAVMTGLVDIYDEQDEYICTISVGENEIVMERSANQIFESHSFNINDPGFIDKFKAAMGRMYG